MKTSINTLTRNQRHLASQMEDVTKSFSRLTDVTSRWMKKTAEILKAHEYVHVMLATDRVIAGMENALNSLTIKLVQEREQVMEILDFFMAPNNLANELMRFIDSSVLNNVLVNMRNKAGELGLGLDNSIVVGEQLLAFPTNVFYNFKETCMSIYISVPLYSKQDVYEVREFFPTPVALPKKEGQDQYYTMLKVDKPILGVRENQRIEMSHADLEKCQVYMGVRYCSMSTSFYAPHTSCLWQSWNGLVGSERCQAGIGRDFVTTASLTSTTKLVVDTMAPHVEVKCLNQPNRRVPLTTGYAVLTLEPGCVATTDRLRIQAETSPLEMEAQAPLALMVPLNFTIDELAAQLTSLSPVQMVDRLEIGRAHV